MPNAIAPSLVFALGQFDLSDRQARLRLRRRNPRFAAARVARASSPSRSSVWGHIRGSSRAMCGKRRRRGRRASDHRRLSRSRGEGHRTSARTRSGHADGAPHRQAPRNSLRCDLRAIHVQDFPARYSPQMGFEGANVLFDSWVHPLMMGLEEHLLAMFRDDPEFHDSARPRISAASRKPSPEPQRGNCMPVADLPGRQAGAPKRSAS